VKYFALEVLVKRWKWKGSLHLSVRRLSKKSELC